MARYNLTICIPTYNRAEQLNAALISIIKSIKTSNENVQICISDNASTDNTRVIVEKHRSEYKNIKYKKQKTNTGFDRNIINVLSMAGGDYCWLMGDDDLVTVNSINKILNSIKKYAPDIILCNRIDCSETMVPRQKNDAAKIEKTFLFNFQNPSDVNEYLGKVTNLCGTFCFISTIVLRKKAFDSVKIPVSMFTTQYIHIYIALYILHRFGRFLYLHEYLVYCRLIRNDFLASLQFVNKFMLELNSHDRILSALSLDEQTKKLYYAVLYRYHALPHLLKFAARATSDDWKKHESMLIKTGYRPLMLKVLRLFFVRIILSFALRIYLNLIKNLILFMSEKSSKLSKP